MSMVKARAYRGVRKTNLIMADEVVSGNVIALIAGNTVELVMVTEVIRHPYGDDGRTRMVTIRGQANYGGKTVDRQRDFRFLDFVTAL